MIPQRECAITRSPRRRLIRYPIYPLLNRGIVFSLVKWARRKKLQTKCIKTLDRLLKVIDASPITKDRRIVMVTASLKSTGSQKLVGSNPDSSTSPMTVPKILSRETGARRNPHASRRGSAVHQVKSGSSTRVAQPLGGCETVAAVERYSKSLRFDDVLQFHKQVNGDEV
jgi:hypothetical protein